MNERKMGREQHGAEEMRERGEERGVENKEQRC